MLFSAVYCKYISLAQSTKIAMKYYLAFYFSFHTCAISRWSGQVYRFPSDFSSLHTSHGNFL